MTTVTIALPSLTGDGFEDYTLTYEYTPPEPSVGWRGGYDILTITRDETGEQTDNPADLNLTRAQLEDYLTYELNSS